MKRNGSTGAWRLLTAGGLVLLFGLIAAACGGDDSDDGSSTADAPVVEAPGDSGDPGSDTATGSSEGDSDEAPEVETEPAPDQGTGGAEGAVVTIGDERFSSDEAVVCITIGGAVGGVFFDETGEIEINIDVPPEDWETSSDGWGAPSIRVNDDRDPENQRQWEAGGEVVATINGVPEGGSQVDSFTVDGSSASGTATFVDLLAVMFASVEGADPPEPMTGTFEISCG